jgi:midasin (ATPase involved in ribosome maturation)
VKGFWIVFEDIDKAPTDVQSVLLPLLEGSSSFSIGHAEVKLALAFWLFDIIIMPLQVHVITFVPKYKPFQKASLAF